MIWPFSLFCEPRHTLRYVKRNGEWELVTQTTVIAPGEETQTVTYTDSEAEYAYHNPFRYL